MQAEEEEEEDGCGLVANEPETKSGGKLPPDCGPAELTTVGSAGERQRSKSGGREVSKPILQRISALLTL